MNVTQLKPNDSARSLIDPIPLLSLATSCHSFSVFSIILGMKRGELQNGTSSKILLADAQKSPTEFFPNHFPIFQRSPPRQRNLYFLYQFQQIYLLTRLSSCVNATARSVASTRSAVLSRRRRRYPSPVLARKYTSPVLVGRGVPQSCPGLGSTPVLSWLGSTQCCPYWEVPQDRVIPAWDLDTPCLGLGYPHLELGYSPPETGVPPA